MKRRTGTSPSVAVEVTVRLEPARQNGGVHVHGSIEATDETVAFDGWLDLLDALEGVAERFLDDGGDGDGDGGRAHAAGDQEDGSA